MSKYIELTSQQKDWFGNRMTSSSTGRVLIPSHLFKKFKTLSGNDLTPNHVIRSILIDECYYP